MLDTAASYDHVPHGWGPAQIGLDQHLNDLKADQNLPNGIVHNQANEEKTAHKKTLPI